MDGNDNALGAHELDWRTLVVEPGSEGGGLCDCCGQQTRRMNGWVHRSEVGETLAAYIAGHTVGRPDDGALFDLIIGPWGEGVDADARFVVTIACRLVDGAISFTVVDADNGRGKWSSLADTYMRREDVIGTPLAQQVFALLDAVYMKEPRLDELRSWDRGTGSTTPDES